MVYLESAIPNWSSITVKQATASVACLVEFA